MRCEFHNNAVRDLAWVIGSPSLLFADRPSVGDAWCRLALIDRIPWLRELDHSPAVLDEWLAQYEGHLLGVRFEQLIEFWLRHWRRVEFIASRVVVPGEAHARGEFDFLFYDRRRRRHVHWEVAVKYYLQYRRESGEVVWLGPNPRDTLAGKLDKVFNHQLRLTRFDETHALLAGLGIEALHSEAFIKGYLFYPSDANWLAAEPQMDNISASHLRGWWTQYPDITVPQQQPESRWLVLERMQWLAFARSHESLPGYDKERLLVMLERHFHRHGRPLLLAELLPDVLGVWREVSRGFVVGESWPAAQPTRRHS